MSGEGRGDGSRGRLTAEADGTAAVESQRSGFDPWPRHTVALWPGKVSQLSEPQFLHLRSGASTKVVRIK